MKTKLAVITGLSVLLIFGLALAVGQSKRERASRSLMRDKLQLSQRALEGIVTGNYKLVITNGVRLSAITREAEWRISETPEYEQQSTIFRHHVDSLVKAARREDQDAMTLAYVRMTMSCVDCHKLVRSKSLAFLR